MPRKPTMTIAARLLIGAAMAAIAAFAGPRLLRAEERPAEAATEAEVEPAPPPTDQEPLPEDIDWAALAVPLDLPYTPAPKLRTAPLRDTAGAAPAWSRNDKPNGVAALSLKQPVSPFWDMKAGVDLDVATPTSPVRMPETLPEKLASDSQVQNSQAAAWMTAKAPGVPYLADYVALEARMNPSRDARLGTAFSKSLPIFGEQFSLTLQHGYYVTQHDAIPGIPATSGHGRSIDMDRSAQLSITGTGTSFLAGQSRTPTGERWLNTVGAQQKLFGALSITGSVSETPEGFSNKSLTAGFKKSW